MFDHAKLTMYKILKYVVKMMMEQTDVCAQLRN